MNPSGVRFVDSRCIHCGAALRVAPDATIVCCQYCNSELQIVRDGATLTTRLLAGMQEIKGDLGQKLEVLRVQNEIERLDREWAQQRESFMVHGKNGASLPSVGGSIGGGVIGVGGGLIFMIGSASAGAPFIFPLFGFVFIVIGIVTAVSGMNKAERHESAHRIYQQRRQSLLTQLAALQNAPGFQ